MKRPHVVWVMADQLRADALGFMGNPIVRTPNLDRLAGRGVVCDRMFVQSPVCMTSRACMLTGRYLRNVHMAGGCPVMDPWQVTVPELLQRAGYRTGMFGKLHLTPQQYTTDVLKSDKPISDAAPFWEATGMPTPLPEDPVKRNYGFQDVMGFEDQLWGEYVPWLAEQAPDIVQRLPLADWQAGRLSGRECCLPLWRQQYRDTGLDEVGVTDIPASLHPSAFIANSAIDFFQQHHHEQPCFLHVSFVDPHHPWDPPREVAAHYPPDEMPLPKYAEARLTWPRSLAGRTDDFSRVTPEQTRTTIAYYYAMIETFDRAVGELVAAIDEAGELDNTIFLFVADHGELLGDFGLWRKGSYHHDLMIRTPFFLTAPGRLPAGRRVDGLTQSIDIAPTLLDLCGVPIHEGMQGDNLADALRQGAPIGRAWAYTEMYTAAWGPFVTCWTLRTPTAKLNYYPQDRVGHLFDLADDPDELRDVWDSPGHRGLRDEMTGALLQAQHEQTDPLPKVLSQY